MSTRATYEFRDERGTHTVYRHHDGYPEGGLQWIANALPFAWELPRFEADDFAAAFVAGNKSGGGGVRLTAGRDAHGDTEYHYVVTFADDRLHVSITERQWSRGGPDSWTPVDEGGLHELLERRAPDLRWLSEGALEDLAR